MVKWLSLTCRGSYNYRLWGVKSNYRFLQCTKGQLGHCRMESRCSFLLHNLQKVRLKWGKKESSKCLEIPIEQKAIVTIKLTKEISVLTISLPRGLNMTMMTCQVKTLPALKAHFETTSLPPKWFLLSVPWFQFSSAKTRIELQRISAQSTLMSNSIGVSISTAGTSLQ